MVGVGGRRKRNRKTDLSGAPLGFCGCWFHFLDEYFPKSPASDDGSERPLSAFWGVFLQNLPKNLYPLLLLVLPPTVLWILQREPLRSGSPPSLNSPCRRPPIPLENLQYSRLYLLLLDSEASVVAAGIIRFSKYLLGLTVPGAT